MAGTDLINRQDALNCINKLYEGHTACNMFEALDAVAEDIEELPSAERVGKWVEHLDMHPLAKEESKYVCSCCGWRTRQVETNGHLVGGYGAEAIGAEWVCTEWEDLFYKYCPNCGARMIGEEEE